MKWALYERLRAATAAGTSCAVVTRLAIGDRGTRFGHHRALDAAARNRPDEFTALVHREVAAFGPGRRSPGLHDRGERHALPVRFPAPDLRKNLVGIRSHGVPLQLAK